MTCALARATLSYTDVKDPQSEGGFGLCRTSFRRRTVHAQLASNQNQVGTLSCGRNSDPLCTDRWDGLRDRLWPAELSGLVQCLSPSLSASSDSLLEVGPVSSPPTGIARWAVSAKT